jgi:hypothetical protein
MRRRCWCCFVDQDDCSVVGVSIDTRNNASWRWRGYLDADGELRGLNFIFDNVDGLDPEKLPGLLHGRRRRQPRLHHLRFIAGVAIDTRSHAGWRWRGCTSTPTANFGVATSSSIMLTDATLKSCRGFLTGDEAASPFAAS